jgi:pSer/pThr/pTyr-binding forkhead associated (FHA) protein
MARLRVTTGKSAGKAIEIGKAAIIGRGETAQLQINDAAASREHCKVFEQGGQWVVADLNSRNGIKVNGVQTTRKNVQHGDTIQIGETTLTFESGGAAAAPAKAAQKPADDVDELDLGGDAEPASKPAAPSKSASPAPSKPAAPSQPPAAKPAASGASKKEEAMAAARADAAKTAAAKTAAAKAGAATKSAPAKAGGAAAKEGMKVSDHVLQYHKVDAKHAGVTDIDLSQMTGTTKFLIFLGCVAILAAIVWAISMMMG